MRTNFHLKVCEEALLCFPYEKMSWKDCASSVKKKYFLGVYKENFQTKICTRQEEFPDHVKLHHKSFQDDFMREREHLGHIYEETSPGRVYDG